MGVHQREIFPADARTVAVLARRHRLPPATAAVVADLAQLHGRDPHAPEPIGEALARAAKAATAEERRP